MEHQRTHTHKTSIVCKVNVLNCQQLYTATVATCV